jgi:hypothetical protein
MQEVDQAQLATFLSGSLFDPPDPTARDFYGCGHGAPGTLFDGLPFAMRAGNIDNYIRNKRFRFAFFDGCETAGDGSLFKSFGATEEEISCAQTYNELKASTPPGREVPGPLAITYYRNYPIRPSLLLGWRYRIYFGHGIDPTTDPTTGKLCSHDAYAAYAHCHQDLMLRWRDRDFQFPRAYEFATSDAASDGSYPPWDIVLDGQEVGKDLSGNLVYFRPDSCLVFAGYGEMNFNEFNRAGDAW